MCQFFPRTERYQSNVSRKSYCKTTTNNNKSTKPCVFVDQLIILKTKITFISTCSKFQYIIKHQNKFHLYLWNKLIPVTLARFEEHPQLTLLSIYQPIMTFYNIVEIYSLSYLKRVRTEIILLKSVQIVKMFSKIVFQGAILALGLIS